MPRVRGGRSAPAVQLQHQGLSASTTQSNTVLYTSPSADTARRVVYRGGIVLYTSNTLNGTVNGIAVVRRVASGFSASSLTITNGLVIADTRDVMCFAPVQFTGAGSAALTRATVPWTVLNRQLTLDDGDTLVLSLITDSVTSLPVSVNLAYALLQMR